MVHRSDGQRGSRCLDPSERFIQRKRYVRVVETFWTEQEQTVRLQLWIFRRHKRIRMGEQKTGQN